jgi:hypothetical protein
MTDPSTQAPSYYYYRSQTTPDLPLWPYCQSRQRTIVRTYRLAARLKPKP